VQAEARPPKRERSQDVDDEFLAELDRDIELYKSTQTSRRRFQRKAAPISNAKRAALSKTLRAADDMLRRIHSSEQEVVVEDLVEPVPVVTAPAKDLTPVAPVDDGKKGTLVHVTLQGGGQGDKLELTFGSASQIKILIAQYAIARSFEPDNVVFQFEGEDLSPESTLAKSVDMDVDEMEEDGVVLDVFIRRR
jgi:hypothetical protein